MSRRQLVIAALTAVVALAASVAAAFFSGSRSSQQDAISRPMVTEGEVAPAFTLESSDGKTVSLGELNSSKNVLLYFSMAHG